MKKTFSFIVLFAFIFGLSAQSSKIHTAAEIIKIIEDSPVTYSLSSKTFTPTDFSDKVLPHNYFRIQNESSYEVKGYEIAGKAQELYDKAEEYFSENDFTEARNYYKKALEVDPNLFKVIVYIGDTYFHQQQYTLAVEWYEKAIKANYIDYLAHWGLAHACMYTGEPKRALKEITIAKVLNRNNQRLNIMLNTIYQANKATYVDWYFDPKFSVKSQYNAEQEKDVVRIEYENQWLPYALVYAVWMYEPGYAESMGNDLLLREKEAVFNTYLAADKKVLKKNTALKMFKIAADQNTINEYIFYECILPYSPDQALFQEPETIEAVADYIINVRSKIKK